jgi:hypothetical protein
MLIYICQRRVVETTTTKTAEELFNDDDDTPTASSNPPKAPKSTELPRESSYPSSFKLELPPEVLNLAKTIDSGITFLIDEVKKGAKRKSRGEEASAASPSSESQDTAHGTKDRHKVKRKRSESVYPEPRTQSRSKGEGEGSGRKRTMSDASIESLFEEIRKRLEGTDAQSDLADTELESERTSSKRQKSTSQSLLTRLGQSFERKRKMKEGQGAMQQTTGQKGPTGMTELV